VHASSARTTCQDASWHETAGQRRSLKTQQRDRDSIFESRIEVDVIPGEPEFRTVLGQG
jgi:hypothetical protein